jgi:predicted GIY-YIG superfamily endonuclease
MLKSATYANQPAENLLRLHHDEPLENPLPRSYKQSPTLTHEHKRGTGSSFAAKYKLDRLAYFDRFDDIRNAIEREKQIKGWLHQENRVDRLCESRVERPEAEWYESHQYKPPKAS